MVQLTSYVLVALSFAHHLFWFWVPNKKRSHPRSPRLADDFCARLQCRERWMHHLDPSLRHVSWTPEEDELLLTFEVKARTAKKALPLFFMFSSQCLVVLLKVSLEVFSTAQAFLF